MGLCASVTPVMLALGRELGCCSPSDSHIWLWAAVEITCFQVTAQLSSVSGDAGLSLPQGLALRHRLCQDICIWCRRPQSQQLAEELWALGAKEVQCCLPVKWGRQSTAGKMSWRTSGGRDLGIRPALRDSSSGTTELRTSLSTADWEDNTCVLRYSRCSGRDYQGQQT